MEVQVCSPAGASVEMKQHMLARSPSPIDGRQFTKVVFGVLNPCNVFALLCRLMNCILHALRVEQVADSGDPQEYGRRPGGGVLTRRRNPVGGIPWLPILAARAPALFIKLSQSDKSITDRTSPEHLAGSSEEKL